MDTRRLLTSILFAGMIMLGIYLIMGGFGGGGGKTYSAHPLYTNLPAQPATQPNPVLNIQLGNPGRDSNDKLSLTVNTLTAGIEKIQLNIKDYADTAKREQPLTMLSAGNSPVKPFATLSVTVDYPNIKEPMVFDMLKAQQVWRVAKQDANSVTLALNLLRPGTSDPLVTVEKTYTIDPASYDVIVAHNVINRSGENIKVRIDQAGPIDLPKDNPQWDNRYYHGAWLNTTKKIIEGEGRHIGHAELFKLDGATKPLGGFLGNDPLLWAGAGNRFFAVVVRPLPHTSTPNTFPLTDGRQLKLAEHVAAADVDQALHGADAVTSINVIRLTGQRIDVAKDGAVTLPLSVYMGPKKRDLLMGEYTVDAAKAGERPVIYNTYKYASMIRYSQGGPCASCTFDWLAVIILKMLDFFVHYGAFGNYGIAIMILVFFVRLLLHPLTKASQVQMATMGQKMSKLQPEIEKVKKRYAKDSKTQQQEMMRLYKEHGVNPAGPLLGCLPMLLQMPIWLALFAGLQADIDLRHAAFIPGWISDLSNPDTLIHWTPFNIPLLSGMMGPISGLNILPLLLGVVFYVQMKVMSASQPKASDPQQAQMQKISQYMILIFPIFLYNSPSGLNVYIFASTLGGLLDTYFVRKTLKKKGILPANAQALPTHAENK